MGTIKVKYVIFVIEGGQPTLSRVSTAPSPATTPSTSTTSVRAIFIQLLPVLTSLISESVSSIVDGSYEGKPTKLVYGVFTTPENAIGGNAICAFRIEDILETFEGPFKEQETANSHWLPVRDMKVPNPRPGKCSQDSTKQPESSLRFIQDHSIMDKAVPAFFGASPLYIRANIE